MLHIQKAVIKLLLELEMDWITVPKYPLSFPIRGLINSTHCNVTSVPCTGAVHISTSLTLSLAMCFAWPLAREETLHVHGQAEVLTVIMWFLPAPYSFPSAASSNVLKGIAPSTWDKEDT